MTTKTKRKKPNAVPTGGTWTVNGNVIEGGYGILPRTEIARVHTFNPVWSGQGGPEVNAANARLIAAAPDLLAACKAALKWIEADESTHGRPFGEGKVLRAAIAKAEGGEN